MKYRVLQKSFIGNALRDEGDIVEYDGEASANLQPLEEPEAKQAKAKPAKTDGKTEDQPLA